MIMSAAVARTMFRATATCTATGASRFRGRGVLLSFLEPRPRAEGVAVFANPPGDRVEPRYDGARGTLSCVRPGRRRSPVELPALGSGVG